LSEPGTSFVDIDVGETASNYRSYFEFSNTVLPQSLVISDALSFKSCFQKMSHFGEAHCFVAYENNQLLSEVESWQEEMRGTLPYLIRAAGSFQPLFDFNNFLLQQRFSWDGGSNSLVIVIKMIMAYIFQ
jgi:nucleoid-associated protein YejK